jgi:L-threonylcarbamoyladenylate synthase
MKYVHYAPQAPLLLFVGSEEALIAAMKRYLDRRARPEYRIGVLAPARMRRLGADAFHSLGNGGAIDYARRLYDGMRALDRQGVDEILAPGIPESGLGLAVMNRLRKAATRILIARK